MPSGDTLKEKSYLKKQIIESENQINDFEKSELDHQNNDTYKQIGYFKNKNCGNNEQNRSLCLDPSREGNSGCGTPITPQSGLADVKRAKVIRKKRRCKEQNC